MTSYNARLLNEPKLRAIVEIADDIADACNMLGDALAEYENTSELSGEERSDARNAAREDAWTQLGEVLAGARRLAAVKEQLETL